MPVDPDPIESIDEKALPFEVKLPIFDVPKAPKPLKGLVCTKLLDLLDDEDDVQRVYSNFREED